jgi:ribosome biogenesis GTPase / thiamine phosphate phosphatase
VEGTVVKSTGSWYTVLLPDGSTLPCKVKGSFKIRGISTTNPVAVGDHVELDNTEDPAVGLIYEIKPRKNYIIRKSVKLSKQSHIIAANIDRAFLVASLVAPSTSMGFIDRFLLTAEAYAIPACVIFNKFDLYEENLVKHAEELRAIYEPLGYACYFMSSFDTERVEQLRSVLSNGVNLFSGQSGVGKSTLVNAIEPGLKLKTGEISMQHLKGTHTTTFAEMHRISSGGFIVDTPGIRDFGVIDLEREEISHFFPEMRELINECQFNNCMHLHEPGCAVKGAVEEKRIHPWRYYSYISILTNEDKFN